MVIPQVLLLNTTVRYKVRWQFEMPVRLLSSPVLKWPDAQTVDKAVRRWAEDIHQNRKDVLRIGYFGSYARGDWGVGSDLDLIVIVKHSDLPFERRSVGWMSRDCRSCRSINLYSGRME